MGADDWSGETRERMLAGYQAVWQGDADVDGLDAIMTPGYIGHIGSRSRGLAELKADIAAYRASAANVRFVVEHRFGQGNYLAIRVSAHATDPASGSELVAAGLNISRWEGDQLAEEWAVWEPLHQINVGPSPT